MTVPAPSLSVLHFLFFSLLAELSSGIIPGRIWNKMDTTCGCRCCIIYTAIALTRVSDTSIFKCTLDLRKRMRGQDVIVLQSKRKAMRQISISCTVLAEAFRVEQYVASWVIGCARSALSFGLCSSSTQSSWLQPLHPLYRR